MIIALKKSMNNEPTSGTTKKAFGELPFATVKVLIFAIALGVAPIAKPH